MSSTALNAHVVHELKDRIHRLESVVEDLRASIQHSNVLSDEHARERIEGYLEQKKRSGQMVVGLLDVSVDLNLPISQTERILEQLQAKGIKEVE